MWIRELGIHYKLGVDGLNLFLILLATRAVPRERGAGPRSREWERPGLFFFWFGLAESGVLGALMAQDLALFVIFFDLMLVPFLFLTGIWGGPGRVRGDHQAVHLHARRLAADARGGDRDRRARASGDGHLSFALSDLVDAAAAEPARRTGSSCASRRRSS